LSLPDILARIVEARRRSVALERRLAPALGTGAQSEHLPAIAPPRGFLRALQEAPTPRIIAECKRASPSSGLLCPGAWDPGALARSYAAAGAAAISVLTEGRHFWGSLDDLVEARAAIELPVLRKDFLVDPGQVEQSRRAGADAVLLIAAVLEGSVLAELLACVHEAGLDALVEVASEADARRAIDAGARLVGVNHRDLRTFEIDLSRSARLAPSLVDAGCFVIAESGVCEPDTLAELEAVGASAFLVGTSLLRSEDPGAALRQLRQLRRLHQPEPSEADG